MKSISMLQLQYLRSILVVNNFCTWIMAYSILGRNRNEGVIIAIGTILLFDWLHSMATIVYTRRRLRAATKPGYFRVPVEVNTSRTRKEQQSDKSKMGPVVTVFTVLYDICFGFGCLVLGILGFIVTYSRIGAVISIGTLVAMVVHFFFVFVMCNLSRLWGYKIKLVIVPRQDEEEEVEEVESTLSSKESSIHQPEHSSPRPYRGSPSTKPSQPHGKPTTGPIKLIEPTEGDVLIADHD